MKIIGSLTSPFVRIVRVLAHELGREYTLDQTVFFLKMTPEQEKLVRTHNPLMKVPVLIDGDKTILDSRIIVNYLLRNSDQQPDLAASFPLTDGEENQLTLIYGALDAGVTRFMLAKTGVNTDAPFMQRSLKRVENAMNALNAQQGIGTIFGIPEIALICCLEWFTKRQVFEWKGLAHIASVHSAWADRPSFVKTRIPEDA